MNLKSSQNIALDAIGFELPGRLPVPMAKRRLLLITIPAFFSFISFSNVVASTTLSLETGVLSSPSSLENGLEYGLGVEKGLLEFKFLEVYSGFRFNYIPVHLKTRFVINAPHDLFYIGIPAGILALYKGNRVEPFIGFETQLDYKAFDYKGNASDKFCNINGECTDTNPGIQPENYEPFIIRASPKIGSIIRLGKAKILISSGLRLDMTTFSRRGPVKTKTSSFVVGTGLKF